MVLSGKEVLYIENKGAMAINASKLPDQMLKDAFHVGYRHVQENPRL